MKFYGNNVHDTGKANASTQYHGVYFGTDSNHLDIGWNTIFNVHGGRGIHIHSSPQSGEPRSGQNQYDISIHDNVIHDTQCDGIILATIDPSKGPVTLYNNVIYDAGRGPDNPERTGGWSCINAPGYTNNGSAGSGAVEIFHNTLYGCGTFDKPPYGNSNTAIAFGGHSADLFLRIRNNIIRQIPTSLFPAGVPYLVIGDIVRQAPHETAVGFHQNLRAESPLVNAVDGAQLKAVFLSVRSMASFATNGRHSSSTPFVSLPTKNCAAMPWEVRIRGR